MSRSLEQNLRSVLALAGFLAAFFAPWWITAALIFLLAMRFSSWEALLLGLLMDFLWLPTGSLLYPLPLFTLGAIAAVWIFEPLRTQFLISS